MQRRVLGSTGVAIPSVILGCGTFGGLGSLDEFIGRGLDERAAYATMDEAIALGIDAFDTAGGYAAGASERMIGHWLARQPRKVASRVRIATKVLPTTATPNAPAGAPLDSSYIEGKLEQSLERLGVESVEFYMAHAPDDDTPIEDTVSGFASVVDSGRARHVGVCNVDAPGLLAALDAADRLGVPGYRWVQNGFSLLAPEEDRELRAVCRDRQIGYTPFSPLAGGVLTGKYRRGEAFPPDTRMALRPEGHDKLLTSAVHDAIDRLRAAAEGRGVSCAALALAWVIAHPDVAAPVVGPSRTAPHLGHVSEALGVTLDPADHAEIGEWFAAASRAGSR